VLGLELGLWLGLVLGLGLGLVLGLGLGLELGLGMGLGLGLGPTRQAIYSSSSVFRGFEHSRTRIKKLAHLRIGVSD